MSLIKKILLLSLALSMTLTIGAVERRVFEVINASDELADNSAQVIVCTKTGRMIISTMGNLNFFNGASFSHVGTHQDYQYQLARYSGDYRLYFDKKHHIWLKNAHTLTCVDLLLEKFVHNVDTVIRSMGCAEPLYDLFVDSVGGVWFLHEHGLYSVNHRRVYPVLRDQNLHDLDIYQNMLLTFYANGEEVAQDLNTGKIIHRTRAYGWDDAQRYNQSSMLLRYNDGYFQVRRGEHESVLLHFDVKHRIWRTIQSFSYQIRHLSVHHDCLYLPSDNGYWVYNIKTQEMEWERTIQLSSGREIETACNVISFDRQNGMWIGTENRGVLYARPTQLQFQSYSLDDPKVAPLADMMDDLSQNITEFRGQRANCLYMDSRGWSWIGTTQGLYLYKSPQSEPVVFTKRTGLYNNVIHAIVEDLRHNIWVSTSNGISFIRLEDSKVKFVNSFSTIDGVPNETFVNCRSVVMDDGRIVMQSIDHIVVFNPDDLEEINTPHPYTLYPKLVKVMANGNYVEPGPDGRNEDVFIDRAVARAREIVINNSKASVSLTFSALNYYRPKQTYYRVRIKDSRDYHNWVVYSFYNSNGRVDNNGMLHIPLVGLEPGTYELEIMASMYPDQWVGKPFRWSIVVNQPWWQTTGLFWLLGIFILALAVLNVVIYIRNFRMRIRRNHEEGDVIRKIRQFVERFDAYNKEQLAPSQDDYRLDDTPDAKLSPEFMAVMFRIIPFVRHHMAGELTMAQLGDIAHMDVVTLYELVMADIYKSPLEMSRQYRLQQVEHLLVTSDDDLSQIAATCGFSTPNYMMGTFFHQYKLTPTEYRDSHHKK